MIDPNEISEALKNCLFENNEITEANTPPENAVIVEGIMTTFAFHPERLEKIRPKVIAWLSQLPEQFHEEKGGGWSFLNACSLRDETQWGEHKNIDELFSLGQGLGLVKCILPRKMWSALPGGMPYYSFSKEIK